MKTKKVIVGAIAASMLSLSVCSLAPVTSAAGEKVQISVSKENAEAGEKFTVEVSLADIPSTGLQAVEFAVTFDDSLVKIDSVKAGPITETGADAKDPTTAIVPVFDYHTNGTNINLTWSTQLSDSTYWLKKDGVFCTISGTVLGGAKDGSVADFKVVAQNRATTVGSGSKNDLIVCGYTDDAGAPVNYGTAISNGSVTVGKGSSTVTPTLRGDANVDGKVSVADVVLIMQSQANPGTYKLSEQGAANADVAGNNDGVTSGDALQIQQFLLHMIDKL